MPVRPSAPAERGEPFVFFDRNGLRVCLLAIGVLGCTTAGCGRPAPDRLLVATTWPKQDRDRLESQFRAWIAASHDHLGHRSVHLEWMPVASERDLVAAASRALAPEVLLGGSAASFKLLAAKDRLSPMDSANSSLWCAARHPQSAVEPGIPPPVAGRSAVDGGNSNGAIPVSYESETAPNPVLKDPRCDPATLDWAMFELDRGRWRQGFAQLVECAATQGRIGRQVATELPIPHRGASPRFDRGRTSSGERSSAEAVAIPRGARNQELAQGFIRFLVDTKGASPGESVPENPPAANPDLRSLVADLLGATLVDGQDELWSAWRSLSSLDEPRQARDWLTEPPPWPPASVSKFMDRETGEAMSLIETLAAELAPDPAARSWLIRSWLSQRQLVDEKLLSELAEAADGRLCREPRFRAWLSEEWTASARQRYRRVARFAAATKTTSTAK
jgi:hypothetical protein